VRPIGPVRKDFSAVSLRSRYTELLRLRGYVQRLERLYQAGGGGDEEGWPAAMDEPCDNED